MKEEFLNSVREAGIYSVQIDSTQDTSTDKCSVILRFVRENVEDRLLAVVDSHSAIGADLCNLLKEVLQKQNIDVSICISDSTDGASNMSRQYNGFTAFLEKESPGHIHTWCYAQVLNLVLCDVTTTNHASISLFGLVQKVGVFFRQSYLRMDMWKELMNQRHGHDLQSRLNLIGATRWWSKHEYLRKIFGTFEDGSSGMFCDVTEVLYCVSTSKKLSVKTRFDTSAMLDNMIRYQHSLTAITYLRIMEITSALSKYLQTSKLDFINAFNMVEATKKDIQQIRRD